MNNLKILKYKIKITLKLFILIIGIPILSFISILNILLPTRFKIKFSSFRSNRIAHFAMGYYVKYAQKTLSGFTPNVIYFIDKSICSNNYLIKSISREFNV